MKKLKKFIQQSKIVLFARLSIFNFLETIYLTNNLAASDRYRNSKKFRADLTIRSHAIEKGLAMPVPRIGFGEAKILELLDLLNEYHSSFGDGTFVAIQLAIISKYFEFQEKNLHSNEILKSKFNKLLISIESKIPDEGGTILVSKDMISKSTNIDFKTFASTRYSIRNFSDETVEAELLNKAFEICRRTPSACNRQPWHLYVFSKERKNDLLKWQGGNNGFTDNIKIAILITGDYNSYFIHEKNQPYVDGGLYAMNLMYALHSLGLGTIPLTMAKKFPDLKFLRKEMKIPINEVPIVILGVGHLKDHFSVAVSERKESKDYITFI